MERLKRGWLLLVAGLGIGPYRRSNEVVFRGRAGGNSVRWGKQERHHETDTQYHLATYVDRCRVWQRGDQRRVARWRDDGVERAAARLLVKKRP